MMNEERYQKLINSPYVEWLEAMIDGIIDQEPVSIAMAVINKDGIPATNYFNCPSYTLASFAGILQLDAGYQRLTEDCEDEEGDEGCLM